MKQLETKQKDFYETPTVLDIRPVSVAVGGGLSDGNDDGNDDGDSD